MNRKAILARLALTVLVTAGIFYVSAGHIVDVAMAHGNPFRTAVVYPLAIDGLILISALTMAANVAVSKETRRYAKLARYFGFAATLFANLAAAGSLDLVDLGVNLIPAVSLILMMEVVISSVKLTPAARKSIKSPGAKPARLRSVA